MKRYLCLYKATPAQSPGENPTEVISLIEEMTTAGVLLAAERCMDSSTGGRLRVLLGDIVTIEGSQAKESISGVLLLQVPSKDDALGWNKRLLTAFGGGECEVYELYPPPKV
jgi:hypothetical protein